MKGISPFAAAIASALPLRLAVVYAQAARTGSELPVSAHTNKPAHGYVARPAAFGAYGLSMLTLSLVGPYRTGALSGFPVLGMVAILFGVRQSGRACVSTALAGGYVQGCTLKFVFLALALASAWVPELAALKCGQSHPCQHLSGTTAG